MKKINIVTFSHAHNYGAMLQAFALSNVLNNNNYEAKLLNYRDNNIEKHYRIFNLNKKNFKTLGKSFVKSIIFHNKLKRRFLNCSDFEKKYLRFTSKEFYNKKDLENYSDCDVLIAGSDQIWNYNITGEVSDIYTLNFGKNVNKISYAASIGDLNIFSNVEKEYTSKIQKINHISVREKDAKEKLQTLLSEDVKEVLDPTLLMTKEEWSEILADVQNIDEKYIVAYVVEPDEEYVKIVNHISKETGLKVVHFGLKNPGYNNVLKSAYTEGPLEFINYIRNAEYVVATSFHATVFSIIFNKKFFIVPHRKTGGRVINLLNKFGIENRIYYDCDSFKKINYKFDTNWDNVLKILNYERAESLNWLYNAISNEDDTNV